MIKVRSQLEKVIKKIQQNPNLGRPYKIEGVPSYAIQGFPYLIFYSDLEDVIWIIAIAHRKRKLDYWKTRQTK
ncbi:hypothetical protein BV375_01375 [Nostoc sp. 106C]|nr:hypothetical protein BV375_01375 [Nostoc sp. 106C]